MPKLTKGQSAVFSVLKDFEKLPDHALVPLAQHVSDVHQSSSSIRSRRCELVRLGLVRQVDTVKMPSGRKAAVWAVK